MEQVFEYGNSWVTVKKVDLNKHIILNEIAGADERTCNGTVKFEIKLLFTQCQKLKQWNE